MPEDIHDTYQVEELACSHEVSHSDPQLLGMNGRREVKISEAVGIWRE